jgi:hypothetical protein
MTGSPTSTCVDRKSSAVANFGVEGVAFFCSVVMPDWNCDGRFTGKRIAFPLVGDMLRPLAADGVWECLWRVWNWSEALINRYTHNIFS